MKTKISEKGQITIPKSIRKSLGLFTGQLLDLEERTGTIIIRPVHTSDPIDRLIGIIKEPVDVDDYLLSTRGPVEDGDTSGDQT